MVKRHNIEAVLQSVPTLIYDATHRVRWHRRLARELATALFWAAWIYWMLPLLTLLAWAAGLHLAYAELLSGPAALDLVYTLPRYVLVVLFISLVGVNWAGLQMWARRGYERRSRIPETPLQEVAGFFRIDLASLEAAHASRIVIAHHDEAGLVRELVSHAPRERDRV
jgi:poly-beta-1,6-N-acetyl-D-glucosamine biosynthesis protein PgaD